MQITAQMDTKDGGMGFSPQRTHMSSSSHLHYIVLKLARKKIYEVRVVSLNILLNDLTISD